MKKILVIVLMILILTGCSKKEQIVYKAVTCDEMQTLVEEGATLIDVRTEVEYNTGHLNGAINMSSTDIMGIIENKIKNKETKIVVYCQSGGRSKMIADKLIEVGYKYVYDLGSINNCTDSNIWKNS
jgi:Rhodanese-related sulfurtransferase